MCFTIHSIDRDTLGFEVRGDVGHGGMRGSRVGPSERPKAPVALNAAARVAAIPGDERTAAETTDQEVVCSG